MNKYKWVMFYLILAGFKHALKLLTLKASVMNGVADTTKTISSARFLDGRKNL